MLTVLAMDDTYDVLHDQVLSGGSVLDNDSQSELEQLVATLVSGPSEGTLNFGSGGNFTYTPPANFAGPVTFTYSASFGSESDQASVTINVTNNAPEAWDGSENVVHDQTLNSSVYATDLDGDNLTYSLAAGPYQGTLNLSSGGSFTYTPGTHFVGAESFTPIASDGIATDTGTFTINVTNNAPVADDGTVDTTEDDPVWGNAYATDLDGDQLTYGVYSSPSHGTLSFDPGGSFTYIPAPGYVGGDSFTFFATDGIDGDTGTITITITITIAEDPAEEMPPSLHAMASPPIQDGTVRIDGALLGDIPPGATAIEIVDASETVVATTGWDSAGQWSASIAIPDDNPTATPADTIEFRARVAGESSIAEASVSVLVENVAPEVRIEIVDPINPNQPGDVIGDGGTVRLRIYLTDIGVEDTHTIHIQWGDGDDDPLTYPPSELNGGYIEIDHAYAPDSGTDPMKVYDVEVTGCDDDSGSHSIHGSVVAVKGTPGATTVTITAIDADAHEYQQDTGTYRLTRTGSTDGDLLVRLGASGDATFKDYTLHAGTVEYSVFWDAVNVVIRDGDSSVDIVLKPKNDWWKEGDDSAVLTIVDYVNPRANASSVAEVIVRLGLAGGKASSEQFSVERQESVSSRRCWHGDAVFGDGVAL